MLMRDMNLNRQLIYIPGRHRSNFSSNNKCFCATVKNIKIQFDNCFNLNLPQFKTFEQILNNSFVVLNSHGYLALLTKMNEIRLEQAGG